MGESEAITLAIEDGQVVRVPIWDNRGRHLNWASTITERDPTHSTGYWRAYWKAPEWGTARCYLVRHELGAAAAVEFIADCRPDLRGSDYQRWFGVVLARSDERLVLARHASLDAAWAAAAAIDESAGSDELARLRASILDTMYGDGTSIPSACARQSKRRSTSPATCSACWRRVSWAGWRGPWPSGRGVDGRPAGGKQRHQHRSTERRALLRDKASTRRRCCCAGCASRRASAPCSPAARCRAAGPPSSPRPPARPRARAARDDRSNRKNPIGVNDAAQGEDPTRPCRARHRERHATEE
jgi:hypothetical protein